MRARERMPCQQAAHKNVGRNFVDQMAQSCQAPELVGPRTKLAVIRNRLSLITFLIYNPKHMKKSTLVNDIPL